MSPAYSTPSRTTAPSSAPRWPCAPRSPVCCPKAGLDLPSEFQRDLSGFIETGCPALVGFELEDPNPGPDGSPRHIVPVIGQTSSTRCF